MRTAWSALAAVAMSGCFYPVQEGLTVVLADAGEVSTYATPQERSDAGTDAGLPELGPLDAGVAPTSQPTEALLGLAAHDCGPADGPAMSFRFSESPQQCSESDVDGFAAQIWGSAAAGRTYLLGPGNLGVSGHGWATLCDVSASCSPVTGGTLRIDFIDDVTVRGVIDVTFENGVHRTATFEQPICPRQLHCG